MAREGDAAADIVIGIVNARIELGIEAPQLPSRARIDSADFVEWRADVEPSLRKDGRILERGAFHGVAVAGHVTGGVGPGDGETSDIGARDLVRLRETLAAGIAAI